MCRNRVQNWSLRNDHDRLCTLQHRRTKRRWAGRSTQSGRSRWIFSEKVSGARSVAKPWPTLSPRCEGDVLLVTRLDRLVRSTRDLLNVLATVSERKAGFRSLADQMIDTTSPHGKLILAVLAALAEFERSMILARTSEGRTRAQARGVRFGRKPKLKSIPDRGNLGAKGCGRMPC